MSPIYNPSVTNITENDETFFRDIGILTNDMTQLEVGRTAFPAFDSTGGTAISITDSVAAAGAAYTGSFAAYDVSGKTKILFFVYMHIGASTYGCGLGFHDSTTYGALTTTIKDVYQFVAYDSSAEIYKVTGAAPTWTELAKDATLGTLTTISTSSVGMALYADGTSVKSFGKWGSTSQWIPINTVSDSTFTNFDEVYLRFFGQSARFMTPLMLWGV